MNQEVLKQIVGRLIEAYRPEKIYLFGSQARGEATVESDFDLMIIVPDDAEQERKRSRLAYEVLWGIKASVDVLVWTASQFQQHLHLKASLPALIMNEGKLLHGV
jgi:predicted nucleotidyltransferase